MNKSCDSADVSVDAKKAATKNPSICSPTLSKDEAEKRAAAHVGKLEDQKPLPGVKSVEDASSSKRLIEHMRTNHASTLIRLRERRNKLGKD